MEALVVENLTKIYAGGRGINGININVQKGKIHALLGNNGAGKSTTMKCIMGIIFPDSGRIEVMGNELIHNNPKVKSLIGFSPELPSFPKNLTGRQCLEIYGYLKGIDKDHLKRESKNLLEKVDLLDSSERKVSKYSRGMLQRLDLAIALMGNPELLILDEPTAGLDPSSASKFRSLLRGLVSEGQTVLLSDHQLSEVERLCSDATIINDGRTMVQSKVSDLLSNFKGRFKYVAEFSSVNEDILRNIEKIDGIFHVEVDQNDGNRLLILADEEITFDSDVSRIAEKAGCSLYSLTESRITLEDIFLSVVRSNE
jgi:ABC-type multidrug transport system ATPase subunit